MLLVVLTMAAIAVVVVGGGAVALRGLVNRRWPADEPLRPAEVLWGEVGGYVQKTFAGLDPTLASDLASYVRERTIAEGEVLWERGDPVTRWVVVKKGALESVGREGVTQVEKGATLGEEELLRRHGAEATIRATTKTVVLELPAEDYLAGVALGAEDGTDELVLEALAGLMADAPQAPPAVAPDEPHTGPSHRVVAGADAFLLPQGDKVIRTLNVDTRVDEIETLPGWSHVRTTDGWQGWVRTETLESV